MLPTLNKQDIRSNMEAKKDVTSRICENYDKVFKEGSTSKRVFYISKKPDLIEPEPMTPSISGFMRDFADCTTMSEESRLKAGFQSSCIINIMPQFDNLNRLTDKVKKTPKNTIINPSIVHIQLRDFHTHPNLQRRMNCLFENRKRSRKITRGTQTLFRESSMQTLPYLPDVSNDKESLKTLELYKLPKILPGDGPPGLFEVEVLERARKRWAFEKIMKEKFECAMKAARSEIARKKQMAEHKTILEAFEWEHWLEREECIQGCQMLRFKLVLCIFEKREREMHSKSHVRIQKSCEQILQKRDQALKKNEIEFGREMRRLRVKHEKKPRNWRKEKISDDLGDPSSEYYGPQMRYGVNPNRRHFQLSRKAFEMRMEDLEKRAVDMKNLECPFAKLKAWSKPKQQIPEVEQNFCTDTNLKKLYESLKGLREKSKKQKIIPKCLVEKTHKESFKEAVIDDTYSIEDLDIDDTNQYSVDTDEEVQVGSSYSKNSLIEMYSQRNSQRFSVAEMLYERRREELEIMLAEYEGTSIGWLMRFLSEEMSRLKEQRKLHFVTMLAQKERWRREAAEAGLRQKENEMRKIYEKIFDETDKANVEVCEQYLDNIFGIDTQEQADYEAITNITELARTIDADLQRWLSSFETIQNPLNYDNLRCLLRDLVFPDCIAEHLSKKYETQSIIDYILNDVIFARVNERLEPIEVAGILANNFVDRLIDNDLYIFSSDCSSGCDCANVCECEPPELEAKAILRKLIRYSVPGRRWRTSTERIAYENVKDVVDDICGSPEKTRRCSNSSAKGRRRTVNEINSMINLHAKNYIDQTEMCNTTTETDSSYIDTITVINYRKAKERHDSITMSLTRNPEELLFQETDANSGSHLVRVKDLSVPGSKVDSLTQPSFLKKVISTFDLSMPLEQFVAKTSDDISSDETMSSNSEKIVILEEVPLETQQKLKKVTEDFLVTVIDEVVKNCLPSDDEAAVTDKPEGPITDRMFVGGWSDDEIFVGETDTEIQSDIEGESNRKTIYPVESSDEPAPVEVSEKQSDYQMVMYACELKSILFDDPDECKCQMEIDYKNYIRELYESGKIKLILKEKPPSIDTVEKPISPIENEKVPSEEDVSPTELIFEYVTSDEAQAVDVPEHEITQLKDEEAQPVVGDDSKESEGNQTTMPIEALEETPEIKNEEVEVEVAVESKNPNDDAAQETEIVVNTSQMIENIQTTAEDPPPESPKQAVEASTVRENEDIVSETPMELGPELAPEQFVEEPLDES